MVRRAALKRALKLVATDIRWGLRGILLNTVAGGWLTPRIVRTGIYRLAGMDVRNVGVFTGCTFVGEALVSIGARTFINRACYFEAVGPITIGDDTLVGMNVMFATSSHPFDDSGQFDVRAEGLPITVGDRCWIGTRVVVLPGVTIGDDVVVAAGAVVTRDCASGGLYAGVPARRLRDIHRRPSTRAVAELAEG